MSAIQMTVTHNGARYSAEVMTIESTMLGTESHGIVTAYLNCRSNGGGTGVGGYTLDSFDKARDRRIGHAFGMEWLMQVMSIVGKDTWEKLTGSRVLVLYPYDENHIGLGLVAVGIANIDTGKALIFKELAEEWFPPAKTAAVEMACEWSDYKRSYGVKDHDREHQAFKAGWESARGYSLEPGVLR